MAALYDGLLLAALLFLATLTVIPFMPGDRVPAGTLWFQLYLLVVTYLFFGWFWTHGGQTLGMRAWRLRVQCADGGNIGWGRAALRYVAAWLAWFSVIGLLWGLFDPQQRTWHDLLSRTQVLRLPPRR